MAVQFSNVPMNHRYTLPERFERKFYIWPDRVGVAYGLLRQLCLPDSDYPSEQINSVYFDTPDLDQHERSASGDLRKDKVRIRWYGREEELAGPQTVFIELKTRNGFSGTKQRRKWTVPAENLKLKNLHEGIIPRSMLLETMAGFGYQESEMLVPVIKISYWRYRYCDILTGQRVSLDCHIRSTILLPEPGNGERALELPGAVLEVKGKAMELPSTLMHTTILDVDWTRFSKYSACIDGHGEQPGSFGRLSPSGRIVW